MVIKPDVARSFPTWTGGDDEGACCCCLFVVVVVVVVVVVAAAVIVVHVAMDVVSMIRLLVGLVVVFLCWLLG